MWPSFRDYHIRFRIVGSSLSSEPMLSLKDPQMRNDTIHLELLLTVGVVRWSKLPWCRQLKDKKNSLLTINNYLLKRIGVKNNTSNLSIVRNCRFIIRIWRCSLLCRLYIVSSQSLKHKRDRERQRVCKDPWTEKRLLLLSHPTPSQSQRASYISVIYWLSWRRSAMDELSRFNAVAR